MESFASMKSKVSTAAGGVGAKINGTLRAKPALFAGIAAGLGFALGLAGRIGRHRRAKRVPLLIVEQAC